MTSLFKEIDMCENCGCHGKSFEDQVQEVIDAVRPMLQRDGGDVELVGTDEDKTVKVRLQGACRGCPGARMTLKMGIERLLKERVPATKEVVAVD
jgi:Fe-S cluster biogenesis protein NfuA